MLYFAYKSVVMFIHFRYVESANMLSKETNLDMGKYDVCDNIDLETILMEYESYYFVRFQKYPKVIKRMGEGGQYVTPNLVNIKYFLNQFMLCNPLLTALRNTSSGGLRKGASVKNAMNVKAGPVTNGLSKASSTPALPKIPPQRSASPGSGRPRSRQGSNTSSNNSKKSEVKTVSGLQFFTTYSVELKFIYMHICNTFFKTSSEDDLLNGLVIQGSNHPTQEIKKQGKPKVSV